MIEEEVLLIEEELGDRVGNRTRKLPRVSALPTVSDATAGSAELFRQVHAVGLPERRGARASDPQDADGVSPARSTPSWRLRSCMC